MTTANILDPIHPELSPLVFDNPADPEPQVKAVHRQWIVKTVHRTLEDAGYEGMEKWLSLVFTGSLTTYQYSDESDVDISLFVDVDNFPEWSRAEMIRTMIEKVDGVTLPGTPHPMQCFVVPPEVTRDDLYKPGMRSGYDLDNEAWIVAPERERVHDVQAEMSASYVHALQQADKMANLLKFEPRSAIMLWHQIHRRRRRDMQKGKGDYSDSNITYKMLANRGIFPQISEITGEYIAKTAAEDFTHFHMAPRTERDRILQHGIHPSNTQMHRDNEGVTNQNLHDQPVGVYMWPKNQKGMMGAKWGWGGSTIPMDIWKVKMNEGEVHPDPDQMLGSFGAVYHPNAIPPERLELHQKPHPFDSFSITEGEKRRQPLHDWNEYRENHRPDDSNAVPDWYKERRGNRMSSDLDIAALALQNTTTNGGITIRIDGTVPTAGYVFSPFKGLEVIIPVAALKQEDIDAFLEDNKQHLIKPQNYLGVWVSGLNTYIDVTQVIEDFDLAYKLAWDADQLAMWDISQAKEIPVRDGGSTPLEIASNFSHDASRLASIPKWKPGKDGKFLVTPEGDVHHWQTDFAGAPHHMRYVKDHPDIDHEAYTVRDYSRNTWTMGTITPGGALNPTLGRAVPEHLEKAMQIPGVRNTREDNWTFSAAPKQVAKFVYNPIDHHLVVGGMAREEGEIESHSDLLERSGLPAKNNVYGQFDQSGRVQTFGRPKIEGYGKPAMLPPEADWRTKQALEQTVPGVKFETRVTPTHDRWTVEGPPKVTYMREPPVVDAEPSEPESDEWKFAKVGTWDHDSYCASRWFAQQPHGTGRA